MTEAEFLTALRALPLHPGALGLRDDAARLGSLVLTTDTLVEGVHYRAGDAPQDVAWKLVATNLSDLAAKGAVPVGVLLNYPLRACYHNPTPNPSPAKEHRVERVPHAQGPSGGRSDPMLAQVRSADSGGQPSLTATIATGPRPSPGKEEAEGEEAGRDEYWDARFLTGFAQALTHYAAPLLGGDTVSLPADAPRVLTLTAIGDAPIAPDRSGAQASDALYVTGTIGAALLGFEHPDTEPNAYRRPVARVADGIALARHVTAMMDVSDGLLLDASRMAQASGLAVEIALDAVPVPPELAHDKLRAVTWGDDYQLLFALPQGETPAVPATRVGRFAPGSGLTLTDYGASVPLPANLGYLHGG